MLPIILYDIPSKLPGKSWSPNPARTRFILSYKNLPFETVWVEYPDIAARLKEIGASPNTMRDGSVLYTVPVISDPNTGAIITDSWAIAEYLDKTYSEKPIFPKGSKSLITAFDTAMDTLGSTGGDSWRFTILRSSQILNERSLGYFIPTREADFGAKVDEWSPEGPVRDAHWKVIERDYYGYAKRFYDRGEGKWLMGDTFSYADIILAIRSLWFKRVYREDEWKRIASLHDGKWEKLLADVEKECNLV
ncbi:hypothetical protein JVU11DRAFT_6571 [Chiua virens]|nr:hypothetical protein JVU11DRAFT_6571 [Chiua virens]